MHVALTYEVSVNKACLPLPLSGQFSADSKLMIFDEFFLQKIGFGISCQLSVQEMSVPVLYFPRKWALISMQIVS